MRMLVFTLTDFRSLKKRSTTTKQHEPFKAPAKSMCSLRHGTSTFEQCLIFIGGSFLLCFSLYTDVLLCFTAIFCFSLAAEFEHSTQSIMFQRNANNFLSILSKGPLENRIRKLRMRQLFNNFNRIQCDTKPQYTSIYLTSGAPVCKENKVSF